ncbi:MAG: glutathione S-transferase [Pseudomonadota bacterium]
MTYELLIADRSYSSWSLRGWLLFAKFDISVTLHESRLYDPAFAQDLRSFPPARSVPAARLPSGAVVMDSLAIAETLAERHPDAGFWPQEEDSRAFARSITAEMHAGFADLRGTFPMNLRQGFADVPVSDAVTRDLARIEHLWSLARGMAGPGDWLFGAYSIADAFFAPIATRIATYGLPRSALAQRYLDTTFADPVFQSWRTHGLNDAPQSNYDMPWAQTSWPAPYSNGSN